MKKAPKRFGYKSGGTPTDPNKVKPLTPNPNYPTIDEQMVAAGLINPTTAAIRKSENENKRLYTENTHPSYNIPLSQAGTGPTSGRTFVSSDANGNITYKDNVTGQTYTLDKTGQKIGFAQGGGIHLNPEHKGDFSAVASRMGMGVQEAAHHIMANKDQHDPHTVQMANFAIQASKWNHKAEGGPVRIMKAPRMNKK